MSEEYQRILNRLLEHIQPKAGDDTPVSSETDLVDEVGLDSVNVMDMVMHIEDDFDVIVPVNQLADIRTPAQLAELILRLEGES
jgi:acyl carrier protein